MLRFCTAHVPIALCSLRLSFIIFADDWITIITMDYGVMLRWKQGVSLRRSAWRRAHLGVYCCYCTRRLLAGFKVFTAVTIKTIVMSHVISLLTVQAYKPETMLSQLFVPGCWERNSEPVYEAVVSTVKCVCYRIGGDSLPCVFIVTLFGVVAFKFILSQKHSPLTVKYRVKQSKCFLKVSCLSTSHFGGQKN